jgi:hypothetical protein
MLPAIVAGPLSTLYVTVPPEVDVALTANGASPYVFPAIGKKCTDGTGVVTLKLVVAIAAA